MKNNDKAEESEHSSDEKYPGDVQTTEESSLIVSDTPVVDERNSSVSLAKSQSEENDEGEKSLVDELEENQKIIDESSRKFEQMKETLKSTAAARRHMFSIDNQVCKTVLNRFSSFFFQKLNYLIFLLRQKRKGEVLSMTNQIQF